MGRGDLVDLGVIDERAYDEAEWGWVPRWSLFPSFVYSRELLLNLQIRGKLLASDERLTLPERSLFHEQGAVQGTDLSRDYIPDE